MIRNIIAVALLLALAYAGWKWLSPGDSGPAAESASASGTPREVYCRLPTARLEGQPASLHVDYAECMRTSSLPLLATFPAAQQEAYKKSGLVR